MKYFVLGASGFIGNNLYNTLKNNKLDVIALNKEQFNITDENTYVKYNFSNSIIIDTIVNVDGNSEEIYNVNLEGIKRFISHLNENHTNFKYVYLSSTSTKIKQQIVTNTYINSKFQAEEFIINNLKDYIIIRLTFPFGKKENPNRLISRLIKQIRDDEKINIDNVTLNLTPVQDLNSNFLKLTKLNNQIINFSDGNVYELKKIIDKIYELMKKEENYTFNQEKRIKLEIINNGATPNYNIIKNKIKETYEL